MNRQRLFIVPCSIRAAKRFIKEHHRHHKAPPRRPLRRRDRDRLRIVERKIERLKLVLGGDS